MAALIQAFNAQTVDPTQGTGQMPIGKHPVVIESSEVKPNKENTGGYLQLDLLIIDGPQKGAKGAYRLNLYNSSQQAAEIAHKQLSAICHVTGVFMVQDSSQLHNIPFIVEVGPQKNDAQYTEVKRVFDIQGNEPGKASAPAQAASPAAFQAPAPAAQAATAPAAPAWGQPAAGQPAPAWGAQAAAPAPTQAQAAPAAAWQAPGQAAAPGATPPWGQK